MKKLLWTAVLIIFCLALVATMVTINPGRDAFNLGIFPLLIIFGIVFFWNLES